MEKTHMFKMYREHWCISCTQVNRSYTTIRKRGRRKKNIAVLIKRGSPTDRPGKFITTGCEQVNRS
jgi:hypothetical protein